MKVEAWSVAAVTHRNLDSEWRYAGRDVPVLHGVRVALRAANTVGEGYAPLLSHLNPTHDDLTAQAQRLAGTMLGWPIDPGTIDARLGPPSLAMNAARSAVEMAALDLAARLRGVSVTQMLGGQARPIAVLRIIPLKSPQRMAEISADLIAQGYATLKLKAEGVADLDIARVRAVRAAVGNSPDLIVDANQSYDLAGAQAFETALRPCRLWSIEQPVPAADRAELAALRDTAQTRIEADEGLFTAADTAKLLRHGIDGISLKLARSGGVLPNIALARAAVGVDARLGTAFGGPLVTLATASLGALVPRLVGAAECAEFLHFDDNDHDWPVVRAGMLYPPDGPGLGQHPVAGWAADWPEAALPGMP